MEEFLEKVLLAILFALYCVLLPFVLVLATPFILLWPGKKLRLGGRARKDIKGRYKRILKIWEWIGLGFPI
jgi:hypothetical protein